MKKNKNEEFDTFGEDDVYNQKDNEGFINLFVLPLTIGALMKKEKEDKKFIFEFKY